MHLKPIWTAGFLAIVTTGASAGEFKPFLNEVAQFESAYKCKDADIVPGDAVFGDLYGCIAGRAQTAKYFINGLPGTGKVSNIKVMWNDWWRDSGYGLHADQVDAMEMVKAAAHLYAPSKAADLLSAMRSNSNQTIRDGGFVFNYTYERGPGIDERLITISEE